MSRFRIDGKARLTVAALVIFAAAAIANAIIIAPPSVCAYYSDATYTTVVGARGTGCCGSVINWGITTPYKKCQKIYCTDQICPN